MNSLAVTKFAKSAKDTGMIGFFLRYVFIALAATAVCFAAVAAVYVFVPFSANTLRLVALIISVLVTLFVGGKAGKDSASVLTAGVTGLIYALLRSVISIAAGFTPLLALRTPFEIITGFLVGIIGGIFGAGTTKRRRRRYR